jgi:hypothetical protein
MNRESVARVAFDAPRRLRRRTACFVCVQFTPRHPTPAARKRRRVCPETFKAVLKDGTSRAAGESSATPDRQLLQARGPLPKVLLIEVCSGGV